MGSYKSGGCFVLHIVNLVYCKQMLTSVFENLAKDRILQRLRLALALQRYCAPYVYNSVHRNVITFNSLIRDSIYLFLFSRFLARTTSL